ncbi:hypothetical protein TeGR_g4723 [Tetraparma gracilis]|uniref:Uncharacterized protein n=1 Tax=Tetraparma gracilis TaxID=2962635 RepID=A0ABQ6MR66_9STRA|nr:hypothetical protein TeGR_g4723 [Tetraparma gracilis]
MGCCFSSSPDSSVELTSQSDDSAPIKIVESSNAMCMYMEDRNCLTAECEGKLAAASAPVCVEQDRSYWECQVTHPGEGEFELIVGVAKKTPLESLAAVLPSSASDPLPSDLYCVRIPDLKKGDVVGVCFDQSDLPMLTFRLNSEITSHHVTRVRGAVFPFVAFTGGDPAEGRTTTAVSVVFRRDKFRAEKPDRFDVLMAASSLI